MMKKFCIFTFLSAALLGAAPLPFLSPAPVIDGKKGDPGWKNALVNTYKSRKKGKAFLARTATHLYVAIDVKHGNPKAFANFQTKHDSAVYNDDCLDFFFTPDPKSEYYYQIIANTRGTIYDHFRNKDAKMVTSWDSGAFARGSLENDSLYIEMMIPISALGCHSNNLSLAVVAFTSWNRMGEGVWGTYHQTGTFTSFEIPETYPVRVKECRWAYAGGMQSSYLTLENLSSAELKLKGTYNGAPVALKLKGNAVYKLECRSSLPAEKEGCNTLQLFNGKQQILHVSRTFTPIKLLKVTAVSDIIYEKEPLQLKISVNEKPTEAVNVVCFPGKAVCTYKGESVAIPYKTIPSPWR